MGGQHGKTATMSVRLCARLKYTCIRKPSRLGMGIGWATMQQHDSDAAWGSLYKPNMHDKHCMTQASWMRQRSLAPALGHRSRLHQSFPQPRQLSLAGLSILQLVCSSLRPGAGSGPAQGKVYEILLHTHSSQATTARHNTAQHYTRIRATMHLQRSPELPALILSLL